MTQHKSVNVKLLNSQLNKLKPVTKNSTEVTLRSSSNMVGNSNDGTNFPYKLILTDRHIARLRRAFSNNSSTNIKLSKTQISKMIQSGAFLRDLATDL